MWAMPLLCAWLWPCGDPRRQGHLLGTPLPSSEHPLNAVPVLAVNMMYHCWCYKDEEFSPALEVKTDLLMCVCATAATGARLPALCPLPSCRCSWRCSNPPPPSPPTFCERCRGLFATHGIRPVHTELSDSGIDFGRLTARSCIIHDCRFSPGEAPTAHIHTDMRAVPIHSTTPDPCPHPQLNTQSPARLDPLCACWCPIRRPVIAARSGPQPDYADPADPTHLPLPTPHSQRTPSSSSRTTRRVACATSSLWRTTR